MDHTKIVPADLDFLRRELSVRGLGFVVALSVFVGKYEYEGPMFAQVYPLRSAGGTSVLDIPEG